MSRILTTHVHPENNQYSIDSGHGYWISEGGGVLITLNKKMSSDKEIEADITSGKMSVLIYATTDRVINDTGQKGGRISFTLPSSLFCKRATEVEIGRALEGRINIPDHYTQRAPGKNFYIVLDENLTMTQKINAVKRLIDKPLVIQNVFSPQKETRRMAFLIKAPVEWSITQFQNI